jgi:hypothetical protein
LIACRAWRKIPGVREIARVAAAAAIAGALGACGVISGLSQYSSEECTDGCFVAVRALDAGSPSRADATLDSAISSTSEASDGTSPVEAAANGGEDATPEGGCATGQLECGDACADPSSATSCGACGNACGGDAALCAATADGSFGCATSCPADAPTECDLGCVDPTSNASHCGSCDIACTVTVAHAQATCTNSVCGFACEANYTLCDGGCIDYDKDNGNCGGCGATFACASGSTCIEGLCQAAEAGASASDAAPDAAAVSCPDGGCPSSTPSGYSCPFGSCNGSTTSQCAGGGGCYCAADDECLSGKCVSVAGENDLSCDGNCTGTGSRDGFNCELASPGIPLPGGAIVYSCPTDSGFAGTQLTCEASHTNCYCTANSQCPSSQCIADPADNGNCSGAGPCSGAGTPDYRGCAPPVALSAGCNGIGYSVSCSIGTCSVINFDPIVTGVCLCTNDDQCDSGKCVSVSGLGGNSTECGSSCTGSGPADEHSCELAPSSVPCTNSAGTGCTTTLTPAPVLDNSGTACLCVADSACSSRKCVDANEQCTGTCTGSGTADNEACETANATPDAWSCPVGNCDTVSSPSGTCTAAGVPCWCTSDSQCPSGALCADWDGCSPGACTGTGTAGVNAFHCIEGQD